jgi:hypothetical protein
MSNTPQPTAPRLLTKNRTSGAFSKSQIAASLVETVGLTKKQAVQTLEALVALAYIKAFISMLTFPQGLV